MPLRVNNIKFGFRIEPQLLLNRLDLLEDLFEIRKRGNIITLRTEDYIYNIFTSGHINATGVRSLDLVEDCLDFFLTLFSINSRRSQISIRIDNISASTSLSRPLSADVAELTRTANAHSARISFNQASFPGITLNFGFGSLIAFRTGKINVVGVKTEKNMLKFESIIAEIESATSRAVDSK